MLTSNNSRNESKIPFSTSKTDVIFQDVLLFIEGVQVPFVAIHINSGIGVRPSASVMIAPELGLLDISKGYQPKVHIFYRDLVDGNNTNRLLFSGIIAAVNYSKSIDANSKTIEFSCVHKYSVMDDLIVDYTGWLNLTTDPQAGVVKSAAANTTAAIVNAMEGLSKPPSDKEITEDNWNGDPSVTPSFLSLFRDRVKGIPGIIVNYWQQLKRDTFNPKLKPHSDSFLKLYLPLVENGLQFFQRMTGHSFIENFIENGRFAYKCKDVVKNIVIAPSTNNFLISAVQAEMGFRSIKNYLESSGELTTVGQIFNAFYEAIDYEMITLTSPAEAYFTSDDSKYAVDTIVKPKLPFYYSPSCNVIYPNMYSSISVSYDDINIPTRIELMNSEFPEEGDPFLTRFRSPYSVRKAIAEGAPGANAGTLKGSTGPNLGKVGLFEQGRGIKVDKSYMPPWLAHLSDTTFKEHINEKWPEKNNPNEVRNFNSLGDLSEGWNRRYPNDQSMNPWSEKQSGISSHHRLLIATAEYYYTQAYARSKIGSIQGGFNPHIIPGYPMDIIGGSPNDPCFHALCTSVTHTITERSIYTDISFAAAMTYAELVNYYVPFVHPWLQVNLGLAKNQTIVNNQEGLETAHSFYNGTLGKDVFAISPDQLYDFSTNTPIPQKRHESGVVVSDRNAQSMKGPNGGELNPNLTYEGNLFLSYREIESLDSIQEREQKTFIMLKPEVYNPVAFKYSNSVLADSEKLELGQSQFLTYENYLVSSKNLASSDAGEEG